MQPETITYKQIKSTFNLTERTIRNWVKLNKLSIYKTSTHLSNSNRPVSLYLLQDIKKLAAQTKQCKQFPTTYITLSSYNKLSEFCAKKKPLSLALNSAIESQLSEVGRIAREINSFAYIREEKKGVLVDKLVLGELRKRVKFINRGKPRKETVTLIMVLGLLVDNYCS